MKGVTVAAVKKESRALAKLRREVEKAKRYQFRRFCFDKIATMY